MINEERFWEASIAEAVSDTPPPDVTARVLTSLAEPERQASPRRGRLRILRWGLELAAAAGVVAAIGIATGLIQLPGGDDPVPVVEVAAAPGTEYERHEHHIELRHGWLLVTTGAPDVHCEGSILTKVDGRVLVHATSMPSRAQAESVTDWLNANQLEMDMMMEAKRWALGVGLAALVLNGSAVLDGQEIKGPEPETGSAEKWHVVRTVMDIDNLPKDARYVEASGLDAAHLEFLVDVDGLRGIRMLDSKQLRSEYLVSLKKLKDLRWLDIRGAAWDHEPDLSPLTELTQLQHVGVDLIPAAYVDSKGLPVQYKSNPTFGSPHGHMLNQNSDGSTYRSAYEFERKSLPALAALAERGVTIELGPWNPRSPEELSLVSKELPTLNGLSLVNPSTADMRVVGAHDGMKSVELTQYDARQIGLAYLTRQPSIESLSLSARGVKLDEIYQISKLQLKRLSIRAVLESSPERSLKLIAGMKTLRELELAGLNISQDGISAFAGFADMQRLDRLVIGSEVIEEDYSGIWTFAIGHFVPARVLAIRSEYLWVPGLDVYEEFLESARAGGQIEVMRFDAEYGEFVGENFDENSVAALKGFTNLKRVEVRRDLFREPVMEDQFVAWLKEHLPGIEVEVTP
jgi:hypothetical protein